MASRQNLQDELMKLLGSKNVYFQPPESIKMVYPAIKFSLVGEASKFADNTRYHRMNRYELIVIYSGPDNPVLDKLLELPYCTFDRPYKSNNLNHDVFTLYY